MSRVFDKAYRSGFAAALAGQPRRAGKQDPLEELSEARAGWLYGWDDGSLAYDRNEAFVCGIAASQRPQPCPYDLVEEHLQDEWIDGWTAAVVMEALGHPETH